MTHYTQMQTPLGQITIVEQDGSLCQIHWSEAPGNAVRDDSVPVLEHTKIWLQAYFDGKAPQSRAHPVLLRGTPFQNAVWRILRDIPYGETMTYGQIAKCICPIMSAQAVGQAVGANPLPIVIPCHRVLGKDGRITGFSAGLEKKRFLLKLEGIPYIE